MKQKKCSFTCLPLFTKIFCKPKYWIKTWYCKLFNIKKNCLILGAKNDGQDIHIYNTVFLCSSVFITTMGMNYVIIIIYVNYVRSVHFCEAELKLHKVKITAVAQQFEGSRHISAELVLQSY